MSKTLSDLKSYIDSFEVQKIDGRECVLSPFRRFESKRQPNYKGTGKALMTVLKKGETVDNFKARYFQIKSLSLSDV